MEDNGELGVGLSTLHEEQEGSFMKVCNKRSVLKGTKELVER
jgi:hypothetical protein